MGMIITWFPYSWTKITTDEGTIYIDPSYIHSEFSSYANKTVLSRSRGHVDGMPNGLEKGDIILVTHAHSDHCRPETIEHLMKEGTFVIAPRQCHRKLGNIMRTVSAGDAIELGPIQVRAVPAYNIREDRVYHPPGAGVGYLLRIGGKTIYHAGDTDLIPEMRLFGRIDLALLPIGGTYTMDAAQAVQAVAALNPKVVVPIHRLKADVSTFKREVERSSGTTVAALGIGESVEI